MKRLNKCMAFGLASLLLIGCSDENPWRGDASKGGISLNLKTKTDVLSTRPSTRASETIDAPDPDYFGLQVVKDDGTPAGRWETLKEYPEDQAFEVGDYSVTAFYGDPNFEGYDAPCFEGSTDITVRPGENSEAVIEAGLANSMVTVTTTDGFKSYFKSYDIIVHSEGGGDVALNPGREGDPVFVKASDNTTVTVNFVKQNGMSAKLQPAKFEAKARHHYYIELNVNSSSSTLEVKFDDEIEATEDVTIDISDKVLNQPAPEMSAEGFTPGTNVAQLEQALRSTPLRFTVFAGAGIGGATLKIESESLNPALLGKEFDLCNLTAMQATELESLGIKAVGIMADKASQIGYVDLAGLVSKLAPGVHRFTLTAKDKMTRLAEPMTMVVDVTPVTLKYIDSDLMSYGDKNATVYIEYNGADPAHNVKVTTGTNKDACRIVSVVAYTPTTRGGAVKRYIPTRAASDFPSKFYKLELELAAVPEVHELPLQLAYGGMVRDDSGKLEIKEYSAEISPYATKAYIQLKALPAKLSSVTSGMKIKANGTLASVLSLDAPRGVIVIGGLTPDTDYVLTFTSASGEEQVAEITTEQALAVPNGDFEALETKYVVNNLNQGGTYQRTLIATGNLKKLQNHQHYTVSEPNGWATNNSKTMSGSPENSWFKVLSAYNSSLTFTSEVACDVVGSIGSGAKSTPGVYSQGAQHGSNAMVIRNVAWDKAGTVPGHKSWTDAKPASYYNENTPNLRETSAGRLFLGSYSYSGGSESFNQGVGFTSRPSALSGYYKYAPDSQDSSECGTVEVVLYGTDGSVIATGSETLEAVGDFAAFNVPLVYTKTFVKAARVEIMFCSSNRAESAIKTTKYASLFLQEAYGAVLVVDNLSFTY